MSTAELTSPARRLSSDAEEARAPAYVWLFLAGLVFSMFSGHSEKLGLPLGLDRPLFLLSLVLLAFDSRTEKLRWRAVYPVMVLTVLWTLFSWMGTGELSDTHKAFALWDRIVMPLSMFAFGALIFSTPYRRLLLLRTAAILGCYLGVTTILEWLAIPGLIFPSYIPELHEGLAEWRALGPFGSGEALGMTAALTLLLSGLLFYLSRGSRWRWVAVAGVILSLVANAMSMTRSAWLGLALAIGLFFLALPQLRRWIPVVIGSLVALAGVIFLAAPQLWESLVLRAGTERSLYDRVNTNDAALRAITAEPLTGIGWGQFLADNVLWVRQGDTTPVTTVTIEVHNVFLSRAAETGVIGAVLWALCILLGPVLVLLATPRLPEMFGWKLVGWGALLILMVPTMLSPNPYSLPNFLIWLICGIAGRGVLVDLPRLNISEQGAPQPPDPAPERTAPSGVGA